MTGTDLLTGPALAGLLTLPGIGEKRALTLASHYKTWENLLGAGINDLTALLGKATCAKYLAHQPPGPLTPDMPAGMRVISRFDADYPARLTGLTDAPLLLWVTGTLPPPDMVAVAVVGTRTPNRWGATVATVVSEQVAQNHFAHVSGLALGVDSLGHQAALRSGGRTWAVLGQGIDVLLNPNSNGDRARLAHDILTSGGGLISEVPPGTPVAPHLLTRRNRIQSGLADGVVIAQTGLATGEKPAGTLHTVRYALVQHRNLLVPRPPESYADATTAGNLALTDPNGCDPALLHVTDPDLAAVVAARRPVADRVIGDRTDSADAIAHLDRYTPAPADDQDATPASLW